MPKKSQVKKAKTRKTMEQAVPEVTKRYLESLSLLKARGYSSLKEGIKRTIKIMLMDLSIQGGFENLVFKEKGETTKINLITLIGREVAREMGINPQTRKRKYRKIKGKIRSEIIIQIISDEELKKKFLKVSERWRFWLSEFIGRSKKLGRWFGKKSVKYRKKRNLGLRKLKTKTSAAFSKSNWPHQPKKNRKI